MLCNLIKASYEINSLKSSDILKSTLPFHPKNHHIDGFS